MKQVPDSLLAFQHMFPDDDACAAWLIEMRWPDGFVCPACGHEKGWALRRKAHTFECAGCRRQTSVTAGTILHASKLPLTVWFWAAYLMATHSNGISARSSRNSSVSALTAALGCSPTLRASMVDPERNPVSAVEIDEASLPFRTKDDPPTGGQGRSHDGKMLIVGAIELGDGNIPGRPAAGRNLLLRRRRPRTLRRNRPPMPSAPTPSRKPTAGPLRRSPPIFRGHNVHVVGEELIVPCGARPVPPPSSRRPLQPRARRLASGQASAGLSREFVSMPALPAGPHSQLAAPLPPNAEQPLPGTFIGKARLEGGAGHGAVIVQRLAMTEHYTAADAHQKLNISSNRAQRDKPFYNFMEIFSGICGAMLGHQLQKLTLRYVAGGELGAQVAEQFNGKAYILFE